jgi:hypothetical protein
MLWPEVVKRELLSATGPPKEQLAEKPEASRVALLLLVLMAQREDPLWA